MANDRPVPGDDDPGETHLVKAETDESTRSFAQAQPWGDLRLLAEIGHGGFGRVFRAWDETLAREVAVKIIKSADASLRTEVLQEGRMLARVNHRNVVTVFRAQQVGDEVGLTMELIKGRHLADLVAHGGPMGAEEASVIGLSLCHALAAVHTAGLLHRDVKAHNVMREAGGRIVLMDFGAGREIERSKVIDHGHDLSGTPLYLAPELFAGGRASRASDIYSLGVLLFYLVTRRYPVEGKSFSDLMLKHRAGRRELLSDLRPDLPNAFVHVVQRALAPQADQRCQSAGAFLTELTEAMPALSRYPVEVGPDVTRRAEQAPPLPTPNGGRTPDVPAPVVTRLGAPARWSLATGLSLLGIGVCGFLTTAHYDRALARRGFSEDSVLDWFRFGFQSLVLLVVAIAALLLVARLASALWFFTKRLVPPIRRAADSARSNMSGRFNRLANDSVFLAQGLLLLQVMLTVAWAFAFRSVLSTLWLTVNDAEPQAFAVLDPSNSNGMLYLYRSPITLVLALLSVSWHWLLTGSPRRHEIPKTTAAAGITLLIAVLMLLEVPHRLFHESEVRQVDYAGQYCFRTGKQNEDLLLYCPDAPKHQRVFAVKSSDPLIRINAPGRIFSLTRPAAGKD